MTPRDDATQAQVDAARPTASTWLAANAGSGKTRVLTDRVARLLLEGVEPQHILCLTYTKAAASEMQNRLFKRLGEWAMLQDDPLKKSLDELGVEGLIDPARLRKARTLFARAIETPGGLKIQTIHSFCASLLRRFPLEAKISPQFTEIEDRAADLLRAEIVEQMADGDDTDLVSNLARHYTGDDFGKLTRAIVQHKEGFEAELAWPEITALFGLPPDFDIDRLPEQVIDADTKLWIGDVCAELARYTPTMVTLSQQLAGVNVVTPDFDDLQTLKWAFLHQKKGIFKAEAKFGSVPTKKAQEGLGALLEPLQQLMERTAHAHDMELGVLAARKSFALHQFAQRFLALYVREKQNRGWLDFDDLILKARQLLTDSNVAAWVLYRIDGGIDHILVDEAQDTSPAQWDVIRKLAAEFSSGEGSRAEVTRTLFVVGDKKQSIYSFQGADPREFDRMEAEFKEKLQAAGREFQSSVLQYSFRSSNAVLRLVDQTFEQHKTAGFGSDTGHIAFKGDLPGRVDLWPVIEKSAEEDDLKWYDPLDRKSAQDHTVILAEQIACQIKQMIDNHQTIPFDHAGGHARRPVTPGDFLILVQRRSGLFSEIIRACKNNGLPIAGADRLKVGGELAVRDLGALLSFLAVPEDSLSLASALKSPLFGWSEQDLFTLAHNRSETHLWQELRNQKNHPKTLEILYDLRSDVGFLRPYDLIERILTRHGGRRKLLARLGLEAEDGINALLSQALAYERTAIPSLTGFLVWMQTDDLEIKRQIDSASDQIRVMTVHGAKGLESPIVILPDTGKRDVAIKNDIIRMDGTPVWKTVADDMPTRMITVIDQMKETELEERLRLLYVALTRAEKWLIVAACGDLPKNYDSWYQLVEAALEHENATEVSFQGLTVKRLSHADWDALPHVHTKKPSRPKIELPAFFGALAGAPVEGRKIISPSDLGGAKALPGEIGRDEDAAKAYGTLVHLYLEHLSATDETDWAMVIQSLAGRRGSDADHTQAASEAQRILKTPEFRYLFDPAHLSEVPICADLGAERLFGFIDRLVLTDDLVLAVDYKTNQSVPATPQQVPLGILRQMGGYAHALAQVYPDRKIQVAVLWTHTGTLMHLPHEIVMKALQDTPYLDADGEAT